MENYLKIKVLKIGILKNYLKVLKFGILKNDLRMEFLRSKFENGDFAKTFENESFENWNLKTSILEGYLRVKFLTLKKWKIKRDKHLAHWGLPQANKGSEQ